MCDEMRRRIDEAWIATVKAAEWQAKQPFFHIVNPPSFTMKLSDPKDEHAAPAPPR